MKMFRRIIFASAFLLAALSISAAARPDRQVRDTTLYPDSYLDTVKVGDVRTLNDYMLIGVEMGAGYNQMMFNPPYSQSWKFNPRHMEVVFTRYSKLFGMYPNFGFKIGVGFSHEGYKMKMNEETGYVASISGATECVYDIIEIPFLAHFHFLDMPHFKIIADLGSYGAKRIAIDRIGDDVSEDMKHTFLETDRRYDYGARAGFGFAFIFDPLEFHLEAKARYSFSNLFQPDFASQYYYRYAYPLDIMVTAGVYFQISKKTGRTKPMLRKEAYRTVYGEE